MSDLKRAESILDWRPRFSFEDGLTPTITWYTANRDPTFVRENLDKVLYERNAIPDRGGDRRLTLRMMPTRSAV